MNDFKDYLAHHGILGMKWGIRRFRNYDGTLTNAGRKRYDSPGNLRYKKTAKEQEARKEKRRTRAKQIAKGLAAAALVGGAGYAAYKLSKKAPSLARNLHRNASLMDINNNPSTGPEFFKIDKKTGNKTPITDSREHDLVEAVIDADFVKKGEDFREQQGIGNTLLRDFYKFADSDTEEARRALSRDPKYQTDELRKDLVVYLRGAYARKSLKAARRPIEDRDGKMIIHNEDSSVTRALKRDWNNSAQRFVEGKTSFKQQHGIDWMSFYKMVKMHGDPYVAYRVEHPETYFISDPREDPAYKPKEWDI